MSWVNVGCGPHRAPQPWLNLDVHEGDGVHPDILVDDVMQPLAGFSHGTVDRVYMGHVMEHVPWPEVPFFLEDIARAMATGGELCVVGPDLFRTIHAWHAGQEPWQLVESVVETPWPYASPNVDGETWSIEGSWSNARHWWNCYEERVVWALQATGLFEKVTAQPLDVEHLGSWPVVAYTQWQCAATAVKP